MIGSQNIPAVFELVADILKVRVAHIFDTEDEAVLVLRDGLADVFKQLLLLLACLLRHLGEVEDAGALGLWHLGRELRKVNVGCDGFKSSQCYQSPMSGCAPKFLPVAIFGRCACLSPHQIDKRRSHWETWAWKPQPASFTPPGFAVFVSGRQDRAEILLQVAVVSV